MGEVQGFVAGLKEAAQRLRGSGSGKESAGISGGRRGHCAGARGAEEGDDSGAGVTARGGGDAGVARVVGTADRWTALSVGETHARGRG